MVKKGIDEVFFKRNKIKDKYGPDKEIPSWFETCVEVQLKEHVKSAVTAYFEKNGETIVTLMSNVIIDRAPEILGQYIVDVIKGSANQVAFNLAFEITQVGRTGIVRG